MRREDSKIGNRDVIGVVDAEGRNLFRPLRRQEVEVGARFVLWVLPEKTVDDAKLRQIFGINKFRAVVIQRS